MRLTKLERPFITSSVSDESVPEAIKTIKTAEMAGARAFEVHLPLLGFPDPDEIEELTSATAYPIYATCRRGSFYKLLGTDETFDITDRERMEVLIDAVEAGFDGLDFELDTFDPTPGPEKFSEKAIRAYANDPETIMAEITDDSTAIDKQVDVIDRVHEAGGEVLVSSHVYKHLTPEDAVSVGKRIEDRGADLAKIVGVDRDMSDLIDTLEAHLALNDALDLPYSLMAIGTVSRIARPISPMFGSAWVFAQPELTPGGFHSWPLIDNQREILRRIDWRTAYDPHENE